MCSWFRACQTMCTFILFPPTVPLPQGAGRREQCHELSTSPTETLMTNLATLQSEDLFGSVGLSEVTAATLRKAHAVHPVSLVENELSLFNLEPEALDVVNACDDLGIAFTAYSPLGRGMLVQRYRTIDDLPKDDNRRQFPRFQGENFAKVRFLAAASVA